MHIKFGGQLFVFTFSFKAFFEYFPQCIIIVAFM